MENFKYYSPTQLVFGKNVISELGKAVSRFGKRVLLVYGGGSVKRNGSYDDIKAQLNIKGAEVFEYSGIKPNPIYEDVDAAAKIGRKNKVDLILALGGGSVIDSAKAIAVTIPVNHSSWKFYDGSAVPKEAIPLIDILTLAATGTETNMFSVIQNDKLQIKTSLVHPLTYPKYAFLDPQYTQTVPANYTAYGIVDLIAHCFEVYFGKGDSTLSDKFIFSIVKEAVDFGPALMNDLTNYELRAKILLASTMALNGITMIGKERGDWGTHSIGHLLSLLFDMPHGASLSVVYPAWMKYHKNNAEERIALLGKNVFGVDTAEETIKAFEDFFKEIGSPIRLSDHDIGEDKHEDIFNLMKANKAGGFVYGFDEKGYRKMVELMK